MKMGSEDQLPDESHSLFQRLSLVKMSVRKPSHWWNIQLMRTRSRRRWSWHLTSNMVLDPQQSSNVLSVFPRFKDVKGLVIIFSKFWWCFDNFIVLFEKQKCILVTVKQLTQFIWLWNLEILTNYPHPRWNRILFGEDVSGKFLEKWSTTFKKKITQQCRKLPSTSELEDLLLTADPPEDGTEVDVDFGKYDFPHSIGCTYYARFTVTHVSVKFILCGTFMPGTTCQYAR